MIIATVLKSGGEYRPEHVARLQEQVAATTPHARFVCLSDIDVPCERIPLVEEWPGWWAKIELFRPELFDGPVIYIDLDSTVLRDVSPLKRDKFTMLTDFYYQKVAASGVMAWTERPDGIWETFQENPSAHMNDNRRVGFGDQRFIRRQVRPDRFEDGLIVSYKCHCADGNIPDGAIILAYHGRPKPWDVKE